MKINAESKFNIGDTVYYALGKVFSTYGTPMIVDSISHGDDISWEVHEDIVETITFYVWRKYKRVRKSASIIYGLKDKSCFGYRKVLEDDAYASEEEAQAECDRRKNLERKGK